MDSFFKFIAQYDATALGLLLGLLLSYFWKYLFPMFQLKYKTWTNGIDGYVSQKIKNQVIREIVLYAILLAQKEMATKSGKERFEYAKKIVIKFCPDILDESVDMILQTLYDEFINANLMDNK
jgi:hypothetical protein